MKIKIYPPAMGVEVDCWIGEIFVQSGQRISAGDVICELETEKASMEFIVEHNGVLNYLYEKDQKFSIKKAFAELSEASTPPKEEIKKTISCTINLDEEEWSKINEKTETTVEHWITNEIKRILKEEV